MTKALVGSCKPVHSEGNGESVGSWRPWAASCNELGPYDLHLARNVSLIYYKPNDPRELGQFRPVSSRMQHTYFHNDVGEHDRLSCASCRLACLEYACNFLFCDWVWLGSCRTKKGICNYTSWGFEHLQAYPRRRRNIAISKNFVKLGQARAHRG